MKKIEFVCLENGAEIARQEAFLTTGGVVMVEDNGLRIAQVAECDYVADIMSRMVHRVLYRTLCEKTAEARQKHRRRNAPTGTWDRFAIPVELRDNLVTKRMAAASAAMCEKYLAQ